MGYPRDHGHPLRAHGSRWIQASNWGDTSGLTRQSLNLVLIPELPQNQVTPRLQGHEPCGPAEGGSSAEVCSQQIHQLVKYQDSVSFVQSLSDLSFKLKHTSNLGLRD